MIKLPIDAHLEEITDSVSRFQVTIIDSPPGSGKSTRVAPYLSEAFAKILMLQPRRVATKMVAGRICEEQGWQLGEQVGYRIRGESNSSDSCRIEIMTEGILTNEILRQKGQLNCDVLILDEFHERSIHCDLIAGWFKFAQERGKKLPKLIIMSATLKGLDLEGYFDSVNSVEIETPVHPLENHYLQHSMNFHDRESMSRQLVETTKYACESFPERSILVFLPGVGEIQNYLTSVKSVAKGRDFFELHGRLSSSEQSKILNPSKKARIIAATNVAETSITVPDVSIVIDSGLEKVGGHEVKTGEDYLYKQRISINSSIQRGGRAARTSAGDCFKLWSVSDERKMAQALVPEILRSDFQLPVFFLTSFGIQNLDEFPWLSKPEPGQIAEAQRVMSWMGVLADGKVSEFGQSLSRYPTSLRLATLLEWGLRLNCYSSAVKIAAVLESGFRLNGSNPENQCDAEYILDSFSDIEKNVQVKNSLKSLPRKSSENETDGKIYEAILRAFPDRLVRRRKPNSQSGKLTGGRGIKLRRESNCNKSEYFVALNTKKFSRIQSRETDVDMASRVERNWIQESFSEFIEEQLQPVEGSALMVREQKLGELVFHQSAPEKLEGDALIAHRIKHAMKNLDKFFKEHPGVAHFLERVRFASSIREEINEFSNEDISGVLEIIFSEQTEREVKSADLKLYFEQWVNSDILQFIDFIAPETYQVGRRRPVLIHYDEAKGPYISMTIQVATELKQHPTIGEAVALGIELTAPNRRAIQFTKDIKSFWKSSYPQIRKELKGRYPKHFWPEEPS